MASLPNPVFVRFRLIACNLQNRPVLEVILRRVGGAGAFHVLTFKAEGQLPVVSSASGSRTLPSTLSIPPVGSAGNIIQSSFDGTVLRLRYNIGEARGFALELSPLVSLTETKVIGDAVSSDLLRYRQLKSQSKTKTPSSIFRDDELHYSAAFPQLGSPLSQTPVLARVTPASSSGNLFKGHIEYGGGRAFDHASTPAFSSPRIGPAPPRPHQPVHAPMARGLVNLGNTVSGDHAQWTGALATGGST